jgi:hypothetical protein
VISFTFAPGVRFAFDWEFSSTNGLKAIKSLNDNNNRTVDGVMTDQVQGVLALCEFSFSFRIVTFGRHKGRNGFHFFKGACLLPGTASFNVLSGELYIPNTSASASFVLMVTVGSAPESKLFLAWDFSREVFRPLSLKSTVVVDDDEDEDEAEE